jgi:hypothetical protein
LYVKQYLKRAHLSLAFFALRFVRRSCGTSLRQGVGLLSRRFLPHVN